MSKRSKLLMGTCSRLNLYRVQKWQNENGQENGSWEKEGAKVERGLEGIQGSGNVLVLNLGGGYSSYLYFYLT